MASDLREPQNFSDMICYSHHRNCGADGDCRGEFTTAAHRPSRQLRPKRKHTRHGESSMYKGPEQLFKINYIQLIIRLHSISIGDMMLFVDEYTKIDCHMV